VHVFGHLDTLRRDGGGAAGPRAIPIVGSARIATSSCPICLEHRASHTQRQQPKEPAHGSSRSG